MGITEPKKLGSAPSCAVQRTDEITVLRFQLVHRRPLRDVLAIIRKPHPALACHVVEVVRETIRGKPARVDLLIHQKVLLVLHFAVHRAALFLDFQDAIAVLIVHTQVAPPQPCRDAFEDMYQKRIISTPEPKTVIQRNELIKRPFRNHLFYGVERQSQPLIARRDDMNDVAQIPRVCAPAFGALLVRKDFDKRKLSTVAE